MKEWLFDPDGNEWSLMLDGRRVGSVVEDDATEYSATLAAHGPAHKGHMDRPLGIFSTLLAAQQAVEAEIPKP